MPDFHVTFRDILHAVNLRHVTNGFTFPSEGRRAEDFFRPEKFRRLRPGLNPRIWVSKASTLPLDHRSRYNLMRSGAPGEMCHHLGIATICFSFIFHNLLNETIKILQKLKIILRSIYTLFID